MSAAGDDVEFSDLVQSCIYEFPKPRKCQDQIGRSQDLINAPEFPSLIQKLIKTTLDKGLANFPDFRIYYTGYAQFFNTESTSPDFCSQNTWSVCPIWQKGCEKLTLTVDLRTQLNELVKMINTQIQTAVDSFRDTNKDSNGNPLVKFVDIDSIAQGHRFCEQGKQEPVKNDDDIWFFQFSDDETKDNDLRHEFYNQVADNISKSLTIEDLGDELLNGTLTVTAQDFLQAEVNVAIANPSLAASINAEGILTDRLKTCHPKIQYHVLIEQKLRDMVKADYSAGATGTPLTCDFSKGSCDAFQSNCPSGATANCVEDHGTGGG